MPKSLADGRTKLAILTTKPLNTASVTLAELAAGIDAAGRILSSDYLLGPTDSDKVGEKPLAQEGNSNALGPSNFQGRLTPFRYYNASTGAVDPSEDIVYAALAIKGTTIWCVERQTGKKSTAAWAATDEIDVYEAITDNPQKPSDMGGYIKRVVPLEIQDAWLGGVVGGTAPVPAISSITPSGAAAAQLVTITGNYFTGATAVTFAGTAAADFEIVSATKIVASLPAGSAGSASVIVTNASGPSTGFAYTRA